MSLTNFWEFVHTQNADRWQWVEWTDSGSSQWTKARDLLLEELRESEQEKGRTWQELGKSNSTNTPRHLLPEILFALAWGAINANSPLPKEFLPQNITFHSTAEEFEDILFQKPPRGMITFFWDKWDEDSFTLPNSRETLVSFLRRTSVYVTKKDSDGDPHGFIPVIGATLGFICGELLDLYPFPPNWISVAENVRQKMKSMTAREKARKQLPHELKSFVDLVGWEEVNTALTSLRP